MLHHAVHEPLRTCRTRPRRRDPDSRINAGPADQPDRDCATVG